MDPVRTDADPGLVLAFVRLVVRPGGKALLLRGDNSRDKWIPIEEAVSSGRSFTIEVGEDILAIDLDQPEHTERLMLIAQELREGGLAPILVRSGRPGHLHLWCCIRDPDRLRAFRDRAKHLGLEVRRSMRPPLAPHRLGWPVSLLDPDDPAEALAALTPPRDPQPLPRWAQKMLRDGGFEPRYLSRSHMIQGLALRAVISGWTEAAFYTALMDPENKAGDKIRHRRDCRQYVARCWAKAFGRAASSRPRTPTEDRERVRAAIMEVGIAVEMQPWRRRGGASEQAVLRAHLALSWGLGRLVWDADVRTIAMLAGLSPAAVVRAHHRLLRAGWLVRIQTSDGRLAATWALPPLSYPRWFGALTGTHSRSKGGRMDVCSTQHTPGDLGHGVWSWMGLGKSTARVWEYLDPIHGRTAQEVAEALGLQPRTVHSHLAKLARYRLAVSEGRGRWIRGPSDSGAIAELLGTADQKAKRIERSAQDRRRWRGLLEAQGANADRKARSFGILHTLRQARRDSAE